MGPMDQIQMPQGMLANGVGGPPTGVAPQIPPQMMPPQQAPMPPGAGGMGIQQAMQDPRIMAYIQALRNGGMGGMR